MGIDRRTSIEGGGRFYVLGDLQMAPMNGFAAIVIVRVVKTDTENCEGSWARRKVANQSSTPRNLGRTRLTVTRRTGVDFTMCNKNNIRCIKWFSLV